MDALILFLRKKLKSRLAPLRYEHSLSVSFTCISLAMRYGADLDKAELAGILHDCGKRYQDSIIAERCKKHGIPVSTDEEKAPAVLHAVYGAWIAENKYGVTDPEILDAIRCHTTGRADMTLLDQILYVADYIEPRRNKASNLAEMRALAYVDLEETLYQILSSTIEYLGKKKSYIEPETMKAYEFYKARRKNSNKEEVTARKDSAEMRKNESD